MSLSNSGLHLFGVTLLGATPENGRKLLLTLAVIVICWGSNRLLRAAFRPLASRSHSARLHFWTRQAISILTAIIGCIGVLSIWFDDPARVSTALGLVTAGLAFALQRVITATAGYLVILRGKTFNVGDRIVMGGVRGDVIALSFMQTKIMEMGQPPPVTSADPAMWVHSRQFTGRIVTVTNDKIFDEPVYNYTYHFPFIWEEMRLPVRYQDDRRTAENILLEAARRHAIRGEGLPEEQRRDLERRYGLKLNDIEPKVYWRITDNWLELALRFLCPDHGTRDIKDAMSREILEKLEAAGIGIGSTTVEITGVPTLQLQQTSPQQG